MKDILYKIKKHQIIGAIGAIVTGLIANAMYDFFSGNRIFSTLLRILEIAFRATTEFLNFEIRVWWLLIGLLILASICFAKRKTRTYNDNDLMLDNFTETNAIKPSLDFQTLSKFIMTNDKIKNFDDSLCKQPNTSMGMHSDEYVDYLLIRLHWIGVLTLEDLIDKINTCYGFAIHYAEAGREPEQKSASFQIMPGTLINYICYGVICQEQSVNKILDFWQITGYEATYKDRIKASEMLQIYNQFYSTDKNQKHTEHKNATTSDVAFDDCIFEFWYKFYTGNSQYNSNKKTFTLHELFRVIAIEMEDVPLSEVAIKIALQKQLLGNNCHFTDEQAVKKILIQLQALDLIHSQRGTGRDGKAHLYWNLSSKGREIRNEMILVKSGTTSDEAVDTDET